MRPPFSKKRLSLTKDGKVKLKLRKNYYTGETHVLFEPVEFLRRLAALVPPAYPFNEWRWTQALIC